MLYVRRVIFILLTELIRLIGCCIPGSQVWGLKIAIITDFFPWLEKWENRRDLLHILQ